MMKSASRFSRLWRLRLRVLYSRRAGVMIGFMDSFFWFQVMGGRDGLFVKTEENSPIFGAEKVRRNPALMLRGFSGFPLDISQ